MHQNIIFKTIWSSPVFFNLISAFVFPEPSLSSPRALIVRQNNPKNGEFSTITAAFQALKQAQGAQVITVYPGTYTEAIHITYKDPLTLQGYSNDPSSLAANQVTIKIARSAAQAGSNAQSSTLWAEKDDFNMHNINLINTYGTGTDTQAVALTVDGQRHVYRRCRLESFQDTLLINLGAKAYFDGCYIAGAVDWIFGAGTAWFEKADVAAKAGKGHSTITAQRRPPGGNSIFVFQSANVFGLPGTPKNSVYLGRPWSPDAAVMFQECHLSDVINSQGWTFWNDNQPNTERIKFLEYENTGPGAIGQRKYGIKSQKLKISDVLGQDYQQWVK